MRPMVTGMRLVLTSPCYQAAEGPIRPPASTPAPISTNVSLRRRDGVSQAGDRATSQARIPVAAAPALIAPTMHCTHMAPTVHDAPPLTPSM